MRWNDYYDCMTYCLLRRTLIDLDPSYSVCYPSIMLGIAESVDGYSRKLVSSLVVGNNYTLQELALILGVNPISMTRKGVVPRGDAQLLFMHLEKDRFSVPQYEDHLEGAVLFWSGQNRIKSVEKSLIDGTRDTFVFIQTARKTPLKYYGRAYPLRMQINWEYDIPSRIAFYLFEYVTVMKAEDRKFIDGMTTLDGLDRNHWMTDIADEPIKTEKDSLQKVRTAQATYRKKVLELWNNKCAVTSVDNTGWLIASHIKPWCESSTLEKIDPFNSLLLTPNYDKLFDRGIISFSPKTGHIILPETQSKEMWNNLSRMHIDDSVSLSFVPDGTTKYLEYHNNYVYSFEPKSDVSNEDFIESLFAKACC